MLTVCRDYILLGEADTPTVIHMLEQIRIYMLAEEVIQQKMMEQYYMTVAAYEEQLEQIRKRMEN